ncbi:MAG: hypothetical protein H0V44_18750 [Planctomycetes bacterium]|nr:hypothetical protein [Planctomycetota bacterium]
MRRSAMVGRPGWRVRARCHLRDLASANLLAPDFHLLDTGAPVGTDMTALSVNRMAPGATAWALAGEVFATAIRAGSRLSMLTSIFEPGGEAFDQKIDQRNTIAGLAIVPVAAGTRPRLSHDLPRADRASVRRRSTRAAARCWAKPRRLPAARRIDLDHRGRAPVPARTEHSAGVVCDVDLRPQLGMGGSISDITSGL